MWEMGSFSSISFSFSSGFFFWQEPRNDDEKLAIRNAKLVAQDMRDIEFLRGEDDEDSDDDSDDDTDDTSDEEDDSN